MDQTIEFYIFQISYKYNIVFQDEEIFVPCNASGVYSGDRYLDLSDMKYEYLANGSVYTHGSMIFIKDLGTEHIGQVF